jgi:3-phenylpropionate/trans-cinnamate dioxygenase ferredoxin reductase component
MHGTIIVGAGQAGLQCAVSLRQQGYAAPITLLGDEPAPPYQRPPLSKAVVAGTMPADGVMLRTPQSLEADRIDFRQGLRAEAIDRASRKVSAGGHAFSYDRLVLATGTSARRLPWPAMDWPNVHVLRSLADARRLQAALGAASVQRLAIIGAGFIGLEVAASARKLGHHVSVVEAAPRVMARAVSPAISAFAEALHAGHGVDLRLGAGVAGIPGTDGRATGLQLASGAVLPADHVLVGIGAVPNVGLAEAAGLACRDGILVDALMQTSDPAILAIGDCARGPNPFFPDEAVRLESVQNAIDQARTAAATILGRQEPYHAVPWFWSDQYDFKLQIAGAAPAGALAVTRGDVASGRFAVLHIADGHLAAVETATLPAVHLLARKLVEAHVRLSPEQAADPAFDLKSLLPR